MKSSNWTRILLGAISGVVATGPMTAAMILLHRRLPARERYPLPPREITMKLADRAALSSAMSNEARHSSTMLGHFGYGAVCGAIYGASTDPTERPVTKGLLFGTLVWVVSYLGWLPAANLLKPANEHPSRRNALMIGVHLVWGLVASAMTALLASESQEQPAGPFTGRLAPHWDVAGAGRR